MNNLHQKIIELRIKESNWKWIIQKVALAIAVVLFLLALLIFAIPSADSDSKKATFTMRINNNYGNTYTISDSSREPEGYYQIVCTSGHGLLELNNISSYFLAADEHKGQKMADQTYAKTATMYLAQGDTLNAHRYDSSKFKLEFHYVGETLE